MSLSYCYLITNHFKVAVLGIESFQTTMMTVAAIDRIIHHATIIEIEGDSYRKKQSLKN